MPKDPKQVASGKRANARRVENDLNYIKLRDIQEQITLYREGDSPYGCLNEIEKILKGEP